MSVSNAITDKITRTKITQFTGSLSSQIVSSTDEKRRFLRFANRTNQAALLSVLDINNVITEIASLIANSGDYLLPFNFQGIIHARWSTTPTTGKLLVVEFYE